MIPTPFYRVQGYAVTVTSIKRTTEKRYIRHADNLDHAVSLARRGKGKRLSKERTEHPNQVEVREVCVPL
jgi:hypothetical protein